MRDESAWIQLASGRKFWPLAPRQEEIFIEDIAHGLALMPRFAGQSRHGYSVAQHSVLVSQHVPVADALSGLLHDASEGMGIPDVASPVKNSPEFWQYREVEDRLMNNIAHRFGFVWPISQNVKDVDLRMLVTERRDLFDHNIAWDRLPPGIEPYQMTITPWGPKTAEHFFLERYTEIVGVSILDHLAPPFRKCWRCG